MPEKNAGDIGKNLPDGVKTHVKLTVRMTDALLFFRKAQRSVSMYGTPVLRDSFSAMEPSVNSVCA